MTLNGDTLNLDVNICNDSQHLYSKQMTFGMTLSNQHIDGPQWSYMIFKISMIHIGFITERYNIDLFRVSYLHSVCSDSYPRQISDPICDDQILSGSRKYQTFSIEMCIIIVRFCRWCRVTHRYTKKKVEQNIGVCLRSSVTHTLNIITPQDL